MKKDTLLLAGQNRKRVDEKQWSESKIKLYPSIGIDTETIDGDIFVISDDQGRRDSTLWRPQDLDSILRWLIKKEHRKAFCFFFNLKFDAECLLKRLTRKELIDLTTVGKVVIERGRVDHRLKWLIVYIPNKKLEISSSIGSITIYDLAQYYLGYTLNLASKAYLKGIGKIDIGSKIFTWEEIDDKRAEITRYNRADAFLCKRLADKMRLGYGDLGVNSYNYLSGATLAERDFINRCFMPKTVDKKGHVVDTIPTEVFDLAVESYRGGWIEAQKRGYIKHGYLYDVNSLYPFIMRDLVDPNNRRKGKGGDPRGSYKWKHTKDYNKKALYGFYRVEVVLNEHTLSPIPLFGKVVNFKGAKRSIYPYGWFEVVVGKDAFEFMIDNLNWEEGKELAKEGIEQAPLTILDSWEFFSTAHHHGHPLRYRIDELYQRKTDIKNEQKKDPDNLRLDNEYNTVKRHLNSLYGKFVQRTPIYTFDPETYKRSLDCERTGQLFNPIWGAIITERARIHVARLAFKDPGSVALIMTDSILFTKKPKDIDEGDTIGQWSLKEEGEALIVMSGAYGFKGKKPIDGLTRMRVFGGLFANKEQKLEAGCKENLQPGLYWDFWDALEAHKNKAYIDVIPYRPLRLKASMVKKLKEGDQELEIDKNFSTRDVGKFTFFPKRVKLVDYKRWWADPPVTCGDLLTKLYESKAWRVTSGYDENDKDTRYRVMPY